MSDSPVYINPDYCARLQGHSVRECICMLPAEGGFIPCPPEARGMLVMRDGLPVTGVMPGDPEGGGSIWTTKPPQNMRQNIPRPVFSGDICADCGSPSMVRTGTCLTCQNCGSTSGGCS